MGEGRGRRKVGCWGFGNDWVCVCCCGCQYGSEREEEEEEERGQRNEGEAGWGRDLNLKRGRKGGREEKVSSTRFSSSLALRLLFLSLNPDSRSSLLCFRPVDSIIRPLIMSSLPINSSQRSRREREYRLLFLVNLESLKRFASLVCSCSPSKKGAPHSPTILPLRLLNLPSDLLLEVVGGRRSGRTLPRSQFQKSSKLTFSLPSFLPLPSSPSCSYPLLVLLDLAPRSSGPSSFM